MASAPQESSGLASRPCRMELKANGSCSSCPCLCSIVHEHGCEKAVRERRCRDPEHGTLELFLETLCGAGARGQGGVARSGGPEARAGPAALKAPLMCSCVPAPVNRSRNFPLHSWLVQLALCELVLGNHPEDIPRGFTMA